MKSSFFKRAAQLCFVAGVGLGLGGTHLFGADPVASTPPLKAVGATKQVQTVKTEQTSGAVKAPALATMLKIFTLDGFRFDLIELASGSTLDSASGSAWVNLPEPLSRRQLTFSGLSFSGNKAKGSVDLSLNETKDFLGWKWELKGLHLSDQGSSLRGAASLAHLRLGLETLDYSTQGVKGTISLEDLVLAEGDFGVRVLAGQLSFLGKQALIKGRLECTLSDTFRRYDTGEPLVLEREECRFDCTALGEGARVAQFSESGLVLMQGGNTYSVSSFDFSYSRGVPELKGRVALQFPLEVLARHTDASEPYRSEVAVVTLQGKKPTAIVQLKGDAAGQSASTATLSPRTLKPAKASLTQVSASSASAVASTRKRQAVGRGAGFTTVFKLPSANLTPSGLTAYRLSITRGEVSVRAGRLLLEGSKVSGSLRWGSGSTQEVAFTDSQVSFADGLYLTGASISGLSEVGAFLVQSGEKQATLDFCIKHSPAGLPLEWQGVYLSAYRLHLPEELFTYYNPDGNTAVWQRRRVAVDGAAGRFDAGGGFSGAVAVELKEAVNLHVSPVILDPFELHFRDGSVLNAPKVTGHLALEVPPLFSNKLELPLRFMLTQGGAREIVCDAKTAEGSTRLETSLIGVDIVLESARLNASNLDFSGRFDFHAKGAELPSIEFAHLTLEGSGGGIESDFSAPSLAMVGSKWDAVAGSPKVALWGYDFSLQESGYGTQEDGRFFVGFGGDFDINPVLSSLYNRVLFTTAKEAIAAEDGQGGASSDPAKEGVIEMEKSFKLDQSLGKMALVKADLDFGVDSVDGEVSEAYFEGNGKLALDVSDVEVKVDAGLKFGRKWEGDHSFPYFYALGHGQLPAKGVQIAPDVELYGLAGGVTQNFLPDEIRNTQDIDGQADEQLGLALLAGVDLGSSDEYAFHGNLDLYIGQDLTTVLQGTAYLFCERSQEPADSRVSADIRFTRRPNAFDATFNADLKQYGGLMRYVGTVALRFSPDEKYLHIGTKSDPIKVIAAFSTGTGYLTADWLGDRAVFGGGLGWSFDSGERSFGVVYGRVWINVSGDVVIVVGKDPSLQGVFQASGGAEFGMKFETFWKTYRLRIFQGDFATTMAFAVPGSPMLSGKVVVHYSVLGGAFSGNASAKMKF